MKTKFTFLFILVIFFLSGYSQCGPNVPTFTVNLTGNPGGTWLSPNVVRNDQCCGQTGVVCVKFIITLDPSATGIVFSIASGAIPSGALYYQINCGPPTPLGSGICLSGPGPHILTFCKPGNNANVYQITSIPGPTGGTNVTVNDGCIDTLHANGFNASTLTWNSIYPGTPGQYNSYLSCTSGCASPIVTGTGTAPPYVDYVVCGQPAAQCNFQTVCDTVRVTFNPTLNVSIIPINPTICFGQTSTTITAIGSGGTPPYSYLWNNVNPSQTINVGVGTYNVQMTDASGCPPVYAQVTVTAFSVAIAANAGPDQIKCSQNPLTTLNATVTGASGGVWSGGAGTFSPNNTTLSNLTYSPTPSELSAGQATLVLTTTGNGTCPPAKDTVKISFLPFTGTITPTVNNVSCFGLTNGSSTVTVSGGPTPYTYTWSTVPTQTTSTASGLGPGTYSVTIKDGIGCVFTTTVAVTQPTPLAMSNTVTNASCNGGSTGSIGVTVSGGTPAYTYAWSPGGQTSSSIANQPAGVYTVTATDSKGCVISATYTISQPTPLATVPTVTNVSCAGGINGAASVVVSGGTSPYTYSWSPSGGTSSTASGLSAGTYTLVATDSKNCTITQTVSITQPTVLTTTVSSTNETCDYSNNGTASISASGGTPAYTYSWQPGAQTSSSISGQQAGTYTVIVTDAKGCQVTQFATITQPPTLSLTTINQNNVSCFGGSNGSVTANPSGGTPNYSYSWSPGGQTGVTATNLSAGTYTLVVTDNNGCIIQNTVTITQPTPLTVTATISNVSCNAGSDGSITANPAGGTPSYTYVWAPGNQATQTVSGLTSGVYTVTVTDSKGCTVTASYTVTQPTPLAISITPTAVSCFGGSNGIASSSVTGGTPGYSYTWSPTGGNSASASGLAAGTYTLLVSDSKNCQLTQTVSITQPTVLSGTVSVTDETCDYLNNGSASVTAGGGTPAYTYTWLPGNQTGSGISNQPNGTYTVIVKDAKGCTFTTTATINQPPTLAVTFTNQVNVSCFGGSNGSVGAVPSGGTPNYTYNWAPGGQTGATATNLPIGTYSVTVTDSHGCTAQNTVTITQPPVLTVTAAISNVSCNTGSDGSITANPGGGTPSYTYQWLPGNQTTQSVSGLTAGVYTVTVTDAQGCTLSASYTVTQPAPLAIAITPTAVSCFGGSNGIASSTVTGGTPAYSYTWSPFGGNASSASGLSAGTYTLLVSDSKNCQLTQTVSITQPTAVSGTTSVTDETCDYLNNGSASATGTGGTPAYTYTWQPGNLTGSSITNQSSGTYTATIKDAKGCTFTTTATINQPPPLAISFTNQVNVSCFGGNNASISANASGGTPNYTYSWSPGGQTGATATNLSAGSYTLTITDAHGCTHQNSVTITQPAAPVSVAMSSAPNVCHGGSAGSATANASGGTAPYTYTWSPGAQTGATINGLPAGTYTVLASDVNGCTKTNTVTVTEPPSITVTTTPGSSTCGNSNGGGTASASGGLGPYTYTWMPGSVTSATITNIPSGAYTVNVTDANGCPASHLMLVNDLSGPTATIFGVTNVTCYGGSNGSATVSVVGGAGTISYTWSPSGGNGPVATGLPAGTYIIFVQDTNGCQALAATSPAISQPPPISIAVTATAVSCFGGNNGIATASASGGTPGYTYLWLPNNTSGATANVLSAGTYTVQVTDANNCIQTQTVAVTQPPAALTVTLTSTPTSCFGGNNGIASSGPSGGTAPYTYTWSPGGFSAQNISNLTAGTYTVNVKDNKGCTTTGTVAVTQPSSITLTPGSNNSTCGNSNGQASVNASGGTPGYTYTWSPTGGNSSTAGGLVSGTYTVQVKDANGCPATASVTVNNTPGPTVTVTAVTHVSCSGGSNGSATTNVSGGTGAISYTWSPTGGNASTGTGMVAGNYTVFIHDANGCQSAATTTVTQPLPLAVAATATAVSCFGGNNGVATASASGGIPGYTYLWLPNNTSGATANALSAGVYTVQVKDANNCVQTQTVAVTQPTAPLSVTLTSTPASCFGGSNGTASSGAAGGTSPYSYTWTPGGFSGQNISNLSAGTYTVNVTDNKGCATTGTVAVTQPTSITLTPSSNNSTCGNSNGQASVNASGGTPGYTYTWSPTGGNSSTAGGLVSGTYFVQVKDANGCPATTSVSVNNTPGPTVTVTSVTNVSCNGGSNGSATANVSGGTGAISYTWSPTGGNASTGTGMVAGNYTVFIQDANGCQAVATTTVTQPQAIAIAVTTTNTSCFGGNNGSASALASGGTPGFSYVWLPGGTTGTNVNSLPAGTFTVQATDANGCVQTQTFVIGQPTAVTASISATSNVSCFGGNNGTATSNVNGGTPFYSYTWTPGGGNGPTGTGFAAGTYTLNVTDSHGCPASTTVTITQPSQPLTASSSANGASCFGGSNGSATVTPSGGTPGYSYQWSPTGGTGPSASGLTSGNYVVLVSDANGCTTNVALTITQTPPITGSLVVNDASCGLNNGSIVSQISGGTSPYSYAWSPGGSTGANITGIGPGTYTLVVTDALNCPQTFSASVNNIPGPNLNVASTTSVSCFGGNNGAATINITSGTSPYSINWSPYGGTTVTAGSLIAGTYTATVTDALGCVAVITANIIQPTQVVLAVSNETDVSCNSGNDGTITVQASGGIPGYTYNWNPGVSNTATASNLTAGIYTATATDANGCPTSITIPVGQPNVLTATISAVSNAVCFNGTGSAAVSVTGGTAPYSYTWSSTPAQTGSTMSNVTSGTYTVSITDAHNCATQATVTITQPTAVVTVAGANDTICLSQTGTINAVAVGGSGNYYYAWQPGAVINSGTYNVSPSSTTVYTVVAYDQNGCAGNPDTVSVVIYNLTAAQISTHGISPICPGTSSTIYASATGVTGPLTYSWNNNLGSGPGAYQVVPSQSTTYIVTVKNSCGQTVVDSIRIDLNAQPTISFYGDTNICVPQSVNFTNMSVAGNPNDPITSWQWNFGDPGSGIFNSSNLQNPTHVYTLPGTYAVTLSVSTSGGCHNVNTTAPFIVHAFSPPKAYFTINSNTLTIPYDSLYTVNTSSMATSYLWNFGDGSTSTATNPSHMYGSVGNFQIQLIAYNQFGCSDTAYREVTTTTNVQFPNAFTPNPDGPNGGGYTYGDLTNDVFFPYTSGVTEFKMQIFNRWGELIFETQDIKKGWDGYYHGKLCQQDVYVWRAFIKFNNGKTFNKAGDVTLLR